METGSAYEVDSYKKINIIFIIIIVFIFFYCFLSPFITLKLQSSCEGMPLIYCKSRGLTRAFSEILKLNFQKALEYNPYSVKIFLFFLVQLASRFFINIKIKWYNFKRVLFLDVILSIAIFLFSFYSLIII
jgi:hypothetical protein